MIDGETLRTARELAGFTQSEVALQLGVNVKSVNNWENGRNKIPRAKSVVLEELLAEQLVTLAMVRSGSDAPSLTAASDVELLSEIGRRLARVTRSEQRREEAGDGDTAPTNVRDLKRQRMRQVQDEAARDEPSE